MNEEMELGNLGNGIEVLWRAFVFPNGEMVKNSVYPVFVRYWISHKLSI